MFARCGKALVVAALVLMTGAHWAALQTVAWTTMLAANLRTQPVTEAVAKTFDGKHPCCLCKAIAAAKKSERKSAATAAMLKLEFPLLADIIVLNPPAHYELLPAADLFADASSPRPLLPPPRRIFA
jgi:hypothetical protein